MNKPTFISSALSSPRWQRLPGWVRKGLIPIAIIGTIAGGGYYAYSVSNAAAPAADAGKAGTGKPGGPPGGPGSPAGKGGGAGGGGRFGGFDPNRVQPVIAVAARTADINVVQTALGTVAALKVATVKADRKSTRLNSSHPRLSRMPSSA